MAKYKRQKVKHYHRSFYSREMRVKRGIGIAVLVVAVLAAAWFAAPHVLDWATHTWYTVVKDRDLEAESASRDAAEIEAAQDAIKAHMTAIDADTLAGIDYKITWKSVTSSRFDSTAFKKAMPELAERFTRSTTSRRFVVA